MVINVELILWIAGAVIAWTGFLVGIIRWLLQRSIRDIDQGLATITEAQAASTQEIHRLDRDLMQMKADMPLHYVRREDYIRGQTVIEAKLDAIGADREAYQRREDAIRAETVINAKLDALATRLMRE